MYSNHFSLESREMEKHQTDDEITVNMNIRKGPRTIQVANKLYFKKKIFPMF